MQLIKNGILGWNLYHRVMLCCDISYSVTNLSKSFWHEISGQEIFFSFRGLTPEQCFLVSWVEVKLSLLGTLAIIRSIVMMMTMSVRQSVEGELAGETEVLGENTCPNATLFTTIPA
jgi:hypothetical protein